MYHRPFLQRHSRLPRLVISLLLPSATHATAYHIGPNQPLAQLGQAPWATLQAGDTVYIHASSTPYREKLLLAVEGLVDKPIVVFGVRDPVDGSLPRLRGDNATTPDPLDFWSEGRGIIKVGGGNTPSATPRHVRIENLDISGARAANSFTDDKGAAATYSANASAIFVEEGEDIVIRGCHLHDNGNGLFVAGASKNVLVDGNKIDDNGNVGSIYEHNSYTEADGIIFQFNNYGALCSGCMGNNLKDRSAGTIIRYNRIDGGNRQLDLVESDFLEIRSSPSYRRTFVYGNLLWERAGSGNRQIVHYGGDGGDESIYRHGVLHFYHNTVYSDRPDRNTLVRLSSAGDTADVRNNAVHTLSAGSNLEILAGAGTLYLRGNWLPTGWIHSFEPLGAVTESGANSVGTNPGFANLASGDFRPSLSSPLRNAAGPLSPDVSGNMPDLALTTAAPLGWTTRTSMGIVGAFAPTEGSGILPLTHAPSAERRQIRIAPGLGIQLFSGNTSIDGLGRTTAVR